MWKEQDLRQLVLSAEEKGASPGDRISCRLEDRFVMTADQGLRKGILPEDLLVSSIFPSEKGCTIGLWEEFFRLIYRKRRDARALILSSRPYVTALSQASFPVFPFLDDMAQIIGTSMKCAPPPKDDRSRRDVLQSLKGRNAVLLHGLGVFAVAGSLEDAVAVCEIAEKACKVFLDGSYLGGGVRIPYCETLLMRFVYRMKYAAQNGKNTIFP